MHKVVKFKTNRSLKNTTENVSDLEMRLILDSLCNKRSSWVFTFFRCLNAQKNEMFLSNQRMEKRRKPDRIACYAVHIWNKTTLAIHSKYRVRNTRPPESGVLIS